MAGRWVYIFALIALAVGALVLARTVFSKPWWVKSAATKWNYPIVEVDGNKYVNKTTEPTGQYSLPLLEKQPLKDLRHFHKYGELPIVTTDDNG